jgi:ribosomal protein L31
MSFARAAARPLALSRISTPSSSRAASTTTNHWKSKTHMRKPVTLPNPLPATYTQRVVLSDGSTFTMLSTAPTPATIRLTRDVTNNPLWAPGSERRGVDDAKEDGRVGRFRRRFADGGVAESQAATPAQFRHDDLDWMSEGAKEEKVSAKQRAGPSKSKGKKK